MIKEQHPNILNHHYESFGKEKKIRVLRVILRTFLPLQGSWGRRTVQNYKGNYEIIIFIFIRCWGGVQNYSHSSLGACFIS